MESLEQLVSGVGEPTGLWFEEAPEIGFGTTLRVRVDQTLVKVRSDFQEILVVNTAKLGRMLVLDGIINLCEFDEFAYHEMIVHVPMLVHPRPERVLIIGGGDGGAVREALKHPHVKEVHLCEIDPKVIEVARTYLPTLSCKLDDPRVTVHHADGARYVREHPDSFDVIIVDSTDPIGPAQVLFQEPFFRDVHASLSEEGIVVSQCESFFYHHGIIRHLFSFLPKLYPVTCYYYTMVPTYPSGTIGFAFGSKKRHPVEDFDGARVRDLGDLKYYSAGVHRAAFELPQFVRSIFTPAAVENPGQT